MSVKSGLKSILLVFTVAITSFVVSTNTDAIKGWAKLFERMARAAASELNPGEANSSKIEGENYLESVESLPNLRANKPDEAVRQTMFAGPLKLKIMQHTRVLKKGLTNSADTTDKDVVTDRDFIDIQVEGDTNGKTFTFFDKNSGTLGFEQQSNDVYRVFVGDASRELTIQAQERDSSPAVITNEINVEVNRKKPTFSLTNDSGKMYDAATGKEVTDKTKRIVVGNLDKLTLKGQSSFPLGEFRVVLDRSGQVVSGNSTVPANGSDQPKDIPVSMSNLGGRDSVVLTLQHGYTDTGTKLFELVSESDPIEIVIDRKGPDLLSVIYDESNRSFGPFVNVSFKDNDLNKGSITKEALKLYRIETGPQEKTEVSSQVNIDGKNSDDRNDRFLVTLPSTLNPGEYEIVLDDVQIPDGKRAKDRVGNSVGVNSGSRQSARFVIFPQGKTGAQVEFPQYLPPKEGNREQPFNPDDFVVTRVARLYYMRDAHRVAQIINRNVRSYNKAAVDVMERVAEKARTEADNLVDARREAERKAVRAAEELRRKEAQLDDVQKSYADAVQIEQQIEDVQASLGRKADGTNDSEIFDSIEKQNLRRKAEIEKEFASDPTRKAAELDMLNSSIDNLKQEATRELREIQNLKKSLPRSADQLKSDLSTYQQQVESLRSEMLDSQESLAGAQSKEDRAKEDQFRKEVSAAKEDPDTYVPGKLDSVDPVTQVSVSVIGEGVIQLRGPIKGVNKIRTMINQIDSPLGQVKIGISTVQINGEHGDRMEKVAQRIEGQIDVSRFLTSHSLMLMRKAVQEVAAEVAVEACGPGEDNLQPGALRGHTQIDRDRRYLYAFFGRDFIDSLFAMNSEFLYTGNHLLSLNSMDNISLNRALFVLALARNDVRERIIERFIQHIQTELPQAEYEYRVTTGLVKHDGKHAFKTVTSEALKRYIFRNFRSVFTSNAIGADTLNPVQLEFLRMAQIFKSQMVAEVELKQRITERGLIQDRANDETQQFEILTEVQKEIRENIRKQLLAFAKNDSGFDQTIQELKSQIATLQKQQDKLNGQLNELDKFESLLDSSQEVFRERDDDKRTEKRMKVETYIDQNRVAIKSQAETLIKISSEIFVESKASFGRAVLDSLIDDLNNNKSAEEIFKSISVFALSTPDLLKQAKQNVESAKNLKSSQKLNIASRKSSLTSIEKEITRFKRDAERLLDAIFKSLGSTIRTKQGESLDIEVDRFDDGFAKLLSFVDDLKDIDDESKSRISQNLKLAKDQLLSGYFSAKKLSREFVLKDATRGSLDHRKLLDHLIDEKEEKYIELVEGTRAYTANIDAYIKRMVVALEDDCRIQYYDPAFAKIRSAAREWDVNLGQVERTTVLTNNRQFAKVEPTATMEFDLPKRDIMITEAMKGAKAMVQDYGALLQDPTFLTATSMLSGSPPTGSYSGAGSPLGGMANQGLSEPAVKSVLPTLPSVPEEKVFNQFGYKRPDIGASLEALIPDPAIYKFETGTGFEIRPVIQPDGDSVIYDFNYMYTTNVREPVRPDEKHLGRVKRHFINTQVQTSTYELREIGRYTVGLKASRTSRGVPLFEDIPGLGILFRPLPSAESSLQQNIILGQSTVYPTLFDLMGLRWAPYVVDLDDLEIQEEEYIVRERRRIVEARTFDESSSRVDDFLRMNERPELYRPDLYRRQQSPSPFHPKGFELGNEIRMPDGRLEPVLDPLNKDFRKSDPRPIEYRKPPFDERTGRLDRVPSTEVDPSYRVPQFNEHGQLGGLGGAGVDPIMTSPGGGSNEEAKRLNLNEAGGSLKSNTMHSEPYLQAPSPTPNHLQGANSTTSSIPPAIPDGQNPFRNQQPINNDDRKGEGTDDSEGLELTPPAELVPGDGWPHDSEIEKNARKESRPLTGDIKSPTSSLSRNLANSSDVKVMSSVPDQSVKKASFGDERKVREYVGDSSINRQYGSGVVRERRVQTPVSNTYARPSTEKKAERSSILGRLRNRLID